MDALNRLLASVLGLLLIAVGVIGILATAGAFDAQTFLDGFFSETITRLSEGSDTTTIVSYAVSSLLIVLGLLLLAVELMQLSTTEEMIVIADDSTGTTQVSSRSVVNLCEKVALSNRDVTSCDCAIERTLEGLAIACKIRLKMGADVPAVTSQVQSSVRDAVESLLGLPVAHVYIDAKYSGRQERSLVAG